jgi:hypothetical protein
MVVRSIQAAKKSIGWFSENEELVVLGIRNFAQHTQLLLWSKLQSAVALFPSAEFQIVDGRLSTLWHAAIDKNGNVEIAIKEWLVDGFWERYHDDESQAVETFQKGMYAIISSSEQLR